MASVTRSAFTLIELLIVVAIIAILAAIAVPNFLEAQVRSKVSRVRADERNLANALESYAIDHLQYPPCTDHTTGNQLRYYASLAPLTTPIAYITSISADPFDKPDRRGGPWAGYAYKERESYIRGWIILNMGDMELADHPTPVWYAKGADGWPWWMSDRDDWTLMRDTFQKYKWAINSEGPDLWPNELDPIFRITGMGCPGWCYPYDASNGTISHGDIARRGP